MPVNSVKIQNFINELRAKHSTKKPAKTKLASEAAKETKPASNKDIDPRWFEPDNLQCMADTLTYLTKPEAYHWQLGEARKLDDGNYYHPVLDTTQVVSNWIEVAKDSINTWRANCPHAEVWTEVKKLMSEEAIANVNLIIKGKPPVFKHLSDNKFDRLSDNSHLYVTDNEKLREEVALRENKPVLGIDTETTGLDPHRHRIRLVQIACEGMPTLVIDCFKCDVTLIQPLLSSNQLKIFHNAKFDLQWFIKAGLKVNQSLFDTQIAYQLLEAGKEDVKCSLKHLAKSLLDIELDKGERLSDWSSDKLSDTQIKYAALDAEVLLPLREKLKLQLTQAGLVKVAKIEFDCTLTVAMMELNGILLDSVKWKTNLSQAITLRDELANQLKPLLGTADIFGNYDINLDSPAQLRKAIKDRLGINLDSTGVSSLKPHASNPAIDLLLKYRKQQKLISSFGDSLLDKINPVTGRVHPSYWQCGSAAGRLSCSNPNLQQIPRQGEVRSAFIPVPGNKLVIADYSQIELRIAAEVAGDKVMLDAYANNQDLHALTASVILNKPLSEVSKSDRQIAKSANFGLLYGAGVTGFQSYAKNSYDIDLSEAEAKKIRDNFFKKYQGLAQWHSHTKANLPKETRTLAGRRRVFPDNGISPQQALNSPVQGLGADILKLALARLPKALEGTGAMILATVHDEIILEAPAERAEEVAKILSVVMVEAGREFLKKVPVEVDVSIGYSWADK